MTDTTPPNPPIDGPTSTTQPKTGFAGWDPRQVMRDRATATRRQRDTAIADLRADLSDDEVLEEFGIDLGEIER